MKNHFIFTLTNPLTNQVCYVGLIKNPYQKLHEHKTSLPHAVAEKNRWIKGVVVGGQQLRMELVTDAISRLQARKQEKILIKKYKAKNTKLLNKSIFYGVPFVPLDVETNADEKNKYGAIAIIDIITEDTITEIEENIRFQFPLINSLFIEKNNNSTTVRWVPRKYNFQEVREFLRMQYHLI